MKKYATIALVILICCTGCSIGHEHDATDMKTNNYDDLSTIIDSFESIEKNVADLIVCFEGYTDMNPSDKYEAVKKAETYTKMMKADYDDFIDHYQGNGQLENIVYQIRLLKNIIPQPIDNSEQALNNAAVLYQLYFQQISSSFSIIASNIDDIERKQDISYFVGYYDELKNMPMPDTMIFGIELSSKVKEDGIIKYTYILDTDNVNAQLNYNLFLIAVGMDTGLSLTFDGNAAYVYKENIMVSVIMAGKDDKLGNFFMVSFLE